MPTVMPVFLLLSVSNMPFQSYRSISLYILAVLPKKTSKPANIRIFRIIWINLKNIRKYVLISIRKFTKYDEFKFIFVFLFLIDILNSWLHVYYLIGIPHRLVSSFFYIWNLHNFYLKTAIWTFLVCACRRRQEFLWLWPRILAQSRWCVGICFSF